MASLANHWKRWDAKPGAVAPQWRRYARPAAIRQTGGNAGTQNQRLRGGPFALCSIGYRISLRPSKTLQRKADNIMKTMKTRRHTCKRLLSVLVALAMCIGMFQSVAFAGEIPEDGKIGRASCRERV